jgi:hypothetical protein
MILHQGSAGDPKTPKTTNVPPKAHLVQIAGPSTQANASGVITRSSRVSRPTPKIIAARNHKRAIVSGFDYDSDESFPSNILPKASNALKKRKLSSMSKSTPSKGKEPESKHNLFQM